MEDKLHTIWNSQIDFSEWVDDLRAEYPDYSDDELYEIACSTNDYYLDDERMNLNIKCGSPIILIADVGRWDGRSSGYRIIQSGNIADCLEPQLTCPSEIIFYVDKQGDLRADESHHDGTNHYLFRKIKKNISEQRLEQLEDSILSGEFTFNEIARATDRLGDKIAAVYGWEDIEPIKTSKTERA